MTHTKALVNGNMIAESSKTPYASKNISCVDNILAKGEDLTKIHKIIEMILHKDFRFMYLE